MRQRKAKINKIAPFIVKLLAILDDFQNIGIIQWFSCNSFVILNISLFTKQVLHKCCKHTNISSFIRQLNAYGFNKEKSTLQANIYSNPNFVRNNKTKLKLIQRLQGNHLKEKNSSDETKYKNNKKALAQKCVELEKSNKDLKNSNKKIEEQIGIIQKEFQEIKEMCYNLQEGKISGRSFILNNLLGQKGQKLILSYMKSAMQNKTNDEVPQSYTWLEGFLNGSGEIVSQEQEKFQNIELSSIHKQEDLKCPSLLSQDRMHYEEIQSFMNENPLDLDDILY